MSFRDRLEAAVGVRGPLCVGIDPHPQLLSSWDLPTSIDGLAHFADLCADAFGGTAAVVKPQSAFFERFGAAGIAVLERTVRALRSAGALVLLDVKRGDIGSTMAAYASAYLDPAAPLAVDAITVSPYLGVGALEPAFQLVEQNEVGVFVLAFTSNAEGASVQRAVVKGSPVGQRVLAEIAARNDVLGYGSLGAVVGATVGDVELAGFNGPLLVPGVGAQGGTVEDVRRLFGAVPGPVLPSTSREVLGAGPDVSALQAAAARLSDSFSFLRR